MEITISTLVMIILSISVQLHQERSIAIPDSITSDWKKFSLIQNKYSFESKTIGMANIDGKPSSSSTTIKYMRNDVSELLSLSVMNYQEKLYCVNKDHSFILEKSKEGPWLLIGISTNSSDNEYMVTKRKIEQYRNSVSILTHAVTVPVSDLVQSSDFIVVGLIVPDDDECTLDFKGKYTINNTSNKLVNGKLTLNRKYYHVVKSFQTKIDYGNTMLNYKIDIDPVFVDFRLRSYKSKLVQGNLLSQTECVVIDQVDDKIFALSNYGLSHYDIYKKSIQTPWFLVFMAIGALFIAIAYYMKRRIIYKE